MANPLPVERVAAPRILLPISVGCVTDPARDLHHQFGPREVEVDPHRSLRFTSEGHLHLGPRKAGVPHQPEEAPLQERLTAGIEQHLAQQPGSTHAGPLGISDTTTERHQRERPPPDATVDGRFETAHGNALRRHVGDRARHRGDPHPIHADQVLRPPVVGGVEHDADDRTTATGHHELDGVAVFEPVEAPPPRRGHPCRRSVRPQPHRRRTHPHLPGERRRSVTPHRRVNRHPGAVGDPATPLPRGHPHLPQRRPVHQPVLPFRQGQQIAINVLHTLTGYGETGRSAEDLATSRRIHRDGGISATSRAAAGLGEVAANPPDRWIRRDVGGG
ncbi:MAG: hypothetical protein RL238_1898 [Actinomycetota bacterium]